MITGEIDGEPYGLRRDGGRRFALVSHGMELATAVAGQRRRWTILFGGCIVEIMCGVKAERRRLEGIAKPLTAVERDR